MNRREARRGAQGDQESSARARPITHQRAAEIQEFGQIAKLPIGLDENVCAQSVQMLNQILADTMTLKDLYKKHHWQVVGETFYQLHLLFDKHFDEQVELVDSIAERIQLLGGISIAMAPDVAETTKIARPPRGREEVPVQLSRLLEAHETILKEAREAAGKADDSGDDGTNDLLISDVIRTNIAGMVPGGAFGRCSGGARRSGKGRFFGPITFVRRFGVGSNVSKREFRQPVLKPPFWPLRRTLWQRVEEN